MEYTQKQCRYIRDVGQCLAFAHRHDEIIDRDRTAEQGAIFLKKLRKGKSRKRKIKIIPSNTSKIHSFTSMRQHRLEVPIFRLHLIKRAIALIVRPPRSSRMVWSELFRSGTLVGAVSQSCLFRWRELLELRVAAKKEKRKKKGKEGKKRNWAAHSDFPT